LRIELADRLTQGGVCGGDGVLAALRRLLRTGQDRSVEGEILILVVGVTVEVMVPNGAAKTLFTSAFGGAKFGWLNTL
jgi:hypothetical protein